MPAYFEDGFFVNEPAWHGLGTVLEDFPGREEAIKLAGHDFTIVEERSARIGDPVDLDDFARPGFDKPYIVMPDGDIFYCKGETPGWKTMVKDMPGDPTHDQIMFQGKESYTLIQNSVGWDVMDMILGADTSGNAKYESAGVLKMGALCWVLAWLDEPIQIKGDDSPILPFICVTWAHDGTASLKARSTTVRVVCANTEAASEAEANRLGTNFTFRHTANYAERIEEARDALKGLRTQTPVYVTMANELAKLKINKMRREEFVKRFIPMPPEAITSVVSDTKVQNIETARAAVRNLLENSPTIPDAHRGTGYGLHLAGTEFLDHLKGNRSRETRFTDSMLRNSREKRELRALIHEVAVA
jgi:phage/plasmid-like protein (TIGR03299 family)